MSCRTAIPLLDDDLLCAVSSPDYAPGMSERLDDAALMLRYCDGEVAAFEQLYVRHKDSLYRYLLRLAGDADVADDVFQEAWGKIVNARRSYRPTARFSTFLFRVAHNCFIDYLRRNRRHAGDAHRDPDDCADPGTSPGEMLDRAQVRQKLAAAVAELPAEQREVFLLRAEGGLNLDEIAHITGVSRETAKSRQRYAMNKLKSAMAKAGAGTEP